MLEGVPEALRPLLPELYAALRQGLATAGEAHGRGDREGVRLAAHGLKGAAMHFGLPELAREAARAGEEAEKGNPGHAAKALARFEELLKQLEAGIQKQNTAK